MSPILLPFPSPSPLLSSPPLPSPPLSAPSPPSPALPSPQTGTRPHSCSRARARSSTVPGLPPYAQMCEQRKSSPNLLGADGTPLPPKRGMFWWCMPFRTRRGGTAADQQAPTPSRAAMEQLLDDPDFIERVTALMTDKRVVATFKQFDTDGSGTIDAKEARPFGCPLLVFSPTSPAPSPPHRRRSKRRSGRRCRRFCRCFAPPAPRVRHVAAAVRLLCISSPPASAFTVSRQSLARAVITRQPLRTARKRHQDA